MDVHIPWWLFPLAAVVLIIAAPVAFILMLIVLNDQDPWGEIKQTAKAIFWRKK